MAVVYAFPIVYTLVVPGNEDLFVPVPPPETGPDVPMAYGAVYVSLCCDQGPVPARVALGAPGAWRWLQDDVQSPQRWRCSQSGEVRIPRGRVITERLRRGDQGVAVDNLSEHALTILVEAEALRHTWRGFDKNP